MSCWDIEGFDGLAMSREGGWKNHFVKSCNWKLLEDVLGNVRKTAERRLWRQIWDCLEPRVLIYWTKLNESVKSAVKLHIYGKTTRKAEEEEKNISILVFLWLVCFGIRMIKCSKTLLRFFIGYKFQIKFRIAVSNHVRHTTDWQQFLPHFHS